jgi:hypothetical protein
MNLRGPTRSRLVSRKGTKPSWRAVISISASASSGAVFSPGVARHWRCAVGGPPTLLEGDKQ